MLKKFSNSWYIYKMWIISRFSKKEKRKRKETTFKSNIKEEHALHDKKLLYSINFVK